VTSITSSSSRSAVSIAAGFLGAFIVGSLAVQLVHTQSRSMNNGETGVDPVIASPATLWAALGERDAVVAPGVAGANVVASPAPAINVEPVVGSEATLWSTLGER
jgi:hypothetical protein